MSDHELMLTEDLHVYASMVRMKPGKISLEINGNDYSTKIMNVTISEISNQVWSVEVDIFALKPGNWSDIMEGKVLKIKYGTTTISKGIIVNLAPTSNYNAKITAWNSGSVALMNWGFANASPAGRYRKSATATNTMVSQLCSEALDAAPDWIISVNTNTNYGNVNFRAENINRMQALRNLARRIGYDWWIDLDGSENDRFNIDTRKGSAASVKTFYTYGASKNCSAAKRVKDKTQLWNAVTVKGYGDGTTQITSSEQTDATSISTWGRHEKVWTDRSIRNVAEANVLAIKIKNDHKDPVNRFTLKINDISQILPTEVVVGDEVTIKDNAIYTAGESEDYKTIARTIHYGTGGIFVQLECASRVYTFVEEASIMKESMEIQESTATIVDPGHDHDLDAGSAASHDHTVTNQNPALSGNAANHGHSIANQSPGLVGAAAANHDHSISYQAPGTTGGGGAAPVQQATQLTFYVNHNTSGLWVYAGQFTCNSTATQGLFASFFVNNNGTKAFGALYEQMLRIYSNTTGNSFPGAGLNQGALLSYFVPANQHGGGSTSIWVPENTASVTYNVYFRSGGSTQRNWKIGLVWYTVGQHTHTVASHNHNVVINNPTVTGNAGSHNHSAISNNPAISGTASTHKHTITAQSPSTSGDASSEQTGVTG